MISFHIYRRIDKLLDKFPFLTSAEKKTMTTSLKWHGHYNLGIEVIIISITLDKKENHV